MLKQEELADIAKFKGISTRFTELDYLQDIALLNIYREYGNRLVFKGGTALYKVYHLNRFSEDLDFTATKGFKAKDFFKRLPYFFKLLDINGQVNVEHFEGATNIYLELYGPLYDGRKETRTTLKFNISLRERVLLPIVRYPYKPVYHEIRPFDLFVMDEREILAEKIRAVYGRNKARDVYDVWYLLKRKNIAFDLLFANKKLSYDKLKFRENDFLAKIEDKKASWRRDLAALISGELPPFEQVKKEIEERINPN